MPERYKALGELRAAMVVGCEFCVDIGSMIARQSGLTDDELKDLIDWQASERLDEKDKLVLEYADAISATPVDVSGRAVRADARALRRGAAGRADRGDRLGELARALQLGVRPRQGGLLRGRVLRARPGRQRRVNVDDAG